MARLLRNVSGLLDSHGLRDEGRWRGLSGGGGGRDHRRRVMADADGLEGGGSRPQGDGMAGVRGQQAGLRDLGETAAVALRNGLG